MDPGQCVVNVITLHYDASRQRERTVNKTKHLHMRVAPELKQDVQRCASSQGMKVTTWVEQVLRDAIKRQRR